MSLLLPPTLELYPYECVCPTPKNSDAPAPAMLPFASSMPVLLRTEAEFYYLNNVLLDSFFKF